MKTFFAMMIILASAISICSTAQQPPQLVDYETKGKGSDFCVSIATGDDRQDVAWLSPYLRSSGRPMFQTRTAQEVIDAFLNQPVSTQKNGIRMRSYFYLVPLAREKLLMTPFQRNLANNPAYRKSESELVEQMKALCEGRGIALFMNTSMHANKPWRLVTDEKTIKDMKNIKPVKRTTP